MKTQQHPELRRPIGLHHFMGFIFLFVCFAFGLWVWSNFGLLMVVDLILVVLWLAVVVDCGAIGGGGGFWWCCKWTMRERERDNRERMRFVVWRNNLIKNLGVLNVISNCKRRTSSSSKIGNSIYQITKNPTK